MIKERRDLSRKVWGRAVAAVLAFSIFFGFIPVVTPGAEAASWMDPYISQVVEWGVMRGDQDGNLNPNNYITRAEFFTMINRAFGYNCETDNPFVDVKIADWYYDDIGFAYNMGYLEGKDGGRAAPLDRLTRQEAAVILARNLMLREKKGEALGFADSRELADWSRGYIEALAEKGIFNGYDDDTFRPKEYITRGMVAAILVRAIGTLVQDKGTYTLGNVYGNVMINTGGVTLKNTVITGDLYLTGGIALEDVLLENVTVYGKIVASGAGESQKGDSSIILRNVDAAELIIDNMTDQFVTLRVEGDTLIGETAVRSEAYIDDATSDRYGLKYIELDGDYGTDFVIAGNIKEVKNVTPGSTLTVASGEADVVTIDEKAVGSSVVIDLGAVISTLNLDTGTVVSGKGDIDHLNVNAAGSTVAMLPDTITIRPGITANIYGEEMDSAAAIESSADPRILAGYPKAADLAPTQAKVVFSTNKKGTVYWAVTALSDGSLGEDDLITSSAAAGIKVASGQLEVSASNTETSITVTGLEKDGSYYISAVMVDNRGYYSPVKVAAFTTTDDTEPDFASGYPYMSKVTNNSAQVTVMTTKTCKLYYAVLPKGSAAPTISEFKAGSISGNLGYGVRDMAKNVIDVFTVNSQSLRELTDYELYLCLIDSDGGNSSDVESLSFKTVDGTPPVFTYEPSQTNYQKNSVSLTAAINEVGTVFWVAVLHGQEYPTVSGSATPSLDSATAKIHVENGIGNIVKNGKVTARANTNFTINISSLQAATAYDVYYVAKDSAGNYSETVKMITVNTLDTEAPTVRQVFSKTSDEEGTKPLADTDIRIIFSEGVQNSEGSIYIDLYNAYIQDEDESALDALAELLATDIKLINEDSATREPVRAITNSAQAPDGAWINYRNVEIYMENSETVFLFRNGKAVNLASGGNYRFEISNVCDTSNRKNAMQNPTQLPEFSVAFAQVYLTSGVTGSPKMLEKDGDTYGVSDKDARIDMSFTMNPLSTDNVSNSIFYDIALLSDKMVYLDVYVRVLDGNNDTVTELDEISMFGAAEHVALAADNNGWIYLGNLSIRSTDSTKFSASLNGLIRGASTSAFSLLNTLSEDYAYEVGLSVTQIRNNDVYDTWSDLVTIEVEVIAGANVKNYQGATEAGLEEGLSSGKISSIGSPSGFYVENKFVDTSVPNFKNDTPIFTAGDSQVLMDLMLDRTGTVYYVIAPVNQTVSGYQSSIDTEFSVWDDAAGKYVTKSFSEVYVPYTDEKTPHAPPISGADVDDCPIVVTPKADYIFTFNEGGNDKIKYDSVTVGTTLQTITVEDLEPLTEYMVYMVLAGTSNQLSDVYTFQFETGDVDTPYITLTKQDPTVNVYTQADADVDWILFSSSQYGLTALNYKLVEYLDAERADDFDEEVKELFPTIVTADPDVSTEVDAFEAQVAGITFMDALLVSWNAATGESVFDHFASSNAKDLMLQCVQAQNLGNAEYASRGGITPYVTAKTTTPVEPGGMSPEGQYYFVAAAKNVLGSVYAFKAIENVRMPDTVPPDISSTTPFVSSRASSTASEDTKDYTVTEEVYTAKPNEYYYRGSVTITFTEAIYKVTTAADTQKKETEAITDTNFKGMLTYDGLVLGDVTVSGGGSTIYIEFFAAENGAYIQFCDEGTVGDMYGNTREQGSRVKITFNTRKTTGAVTTTSPHLTVEWTDGTTA